MAPASLNGLRQRLSSANIKHIVSIKQTKCFIWFAIFLPVSLAAQAKLESKMLVNSRLALVSVGKPSPQQSPFTLKIIENLHVSTWQKTPPSSLDLNRKSILFQAYDPDKLPVFCKMEHRMAKRLPVPVLFRLGSVDYVNYLEGKDRFDAHH